MFDRLIYSDESRRWHTYLISSQSTTPSGVLDRLHVTVAALRSICVLRETMGGDMRGHARIRSLMLTEGNGFVAELEVCSASIPSSMSCQLEAGWC